MNPVDVSDQLLRAALAGFEVVTFTGTGLIVEGSPVADLTALVDRRSGIVTTFWAPDEIEVVDLANGAQVALALQTGGAMPPVSLIVRDLRGG